MHFHWIALKYFRETVRAKSVRKAAERLNVAPSAVNRQIIKLEQQVACPLFERSAAGMRLTSPGEVFYHYVLKAQGDLERALSEIDDLRGVRSGHVTVSCEEGLAKDLLPDVVAAYRTRHPRVTFSITVRDMPTIVREVADSAADIGLAFNPRRDPHIKRRAEAVVAIGAVMRPDHALAHRATLRLADLVGEALIVADGGYSIRHLLDEQFDGDGETLFKHVLETNSFEAMTANIMVGLGVGIRSQMGIRRELARGDVVFVPISERNFRCETITVLSRSRRALPVAAEVLIAQLTTALEQLRDADRAVDQRVAAVVEPT